MGRIVLIDQIWLAAVIAVVVYGLFQPAARRVITQMVMAGATLPPFWTSPSLGIGGAGAMLVLMIKGIGKFAIAGWKALRGAARRLEPAIAARAANFNI